MSAIKNFAMDIAEREGIDFKEVTDDHIAKELERRAKLREDKKNGKN